MRRVLVAVAMFVVVTGCRAPRQTFDLVIRGGQVYDGVSAEPQYVDVAINGDRIAAVGALADAAALREINAVGLVVAPGFIDVQSRSGTSLLADGAAESHLRQGITSEIIGDRDSPAFWTPSTADVATLRPFGVAFDWSGFDGYFEQLVRRGMTVNLGTMIPLAQTDGTPAVVEQGLRRGALGVAVMRGQVSARERTLGELLDLARSVAAHGGSVAIQTIGSRDQVLAGVDEAIDIARQANVPVVVYQPEVAGSDDDVLGELLAKIQAARAQGVSIHSTAAPEGEGDDTARGWWFRDSGASIGSQSAAVPADGILASKTAHPRAYAAFTTVLADYVRDDNVLSLGEAIRRMTSNAADQFRLEGRGIIRSGSIADVIVFDLAKVRLHATAERPHQHSTGMQHVIVNGVPVLDPNGLTGARPGRPMFGRARSSERPAS